MKSMNVSLPDALREYVEGQLGSGRCSSASEYVRELIREDDKRRARERLRGKAAEVSESGSSDSEG